MYEMSSGKELTHVLPLDEDYKAIEDPGCRKIVHYIFQRKSKRHMKHTISQVRGFATKRVGESVLLIFSADQKEEFLFSVKIGM